MGRRFFLADDVNEENQHPAQHRQHDTEQFAIGECFRFAGVEVALIDHEFHHYCQRWARRYMRRKLRRRLPSAVAPPVAARPDVPLSKTRVRLFKGRKLARIGLR